MSESDWEVTGPEIRQRLVRANALNLKLEAIERAARAYLQAPSPDVTIFRKTKLAQAIADCDKYREENATDD